MLLTCENFRIKNFLKTVRLLVQHRPPPQFNTSVEHKDHTFSALKIPQFNTLLNSTPKTPQFNTKTPSIQH